MHRRHFVDRIDTAGRTGAVNGELIYHGLDFRFEDAPTVNAVKRTWQDDHTFVIDSGTPHLAHRLAGARGLTAVDSVLENFLQEISERRPPDEHAMGSGQDGVDMFDIQLT